MLPPLNQEVLREFDCLAGHGETVFWLHVFVTKDRLYFGSHVSCLVNWLAPWGVVWTLPDTFHLTVDDFICWPDIGWLISEYLEQT